MEIKVAGCGFLSLNACRHIAVNLETSFLLSFRQQMIASAIFRARCLDVRDLRVEYMFCAIKILMVLSLDTNNDHRMAPTCGLIEQYKLILL